MKRLYLSFLILVSLTSICYAEPSGFLYMLNVMEIPSQNLSGLSINEDIYYKYQLFVYGTPEMISSRSKMERCSGGKLGKKRKKGRVLDIGAELSRKRSS